jgi:hypothetical protein
MDYPIPSDKLGYDPGQVRDNVLHWSSSAHRERTLWSHTLYETPRSEILQCASTFRTSFAIWSHRLAVRTLASHAGNRGSNPLGTTKANARLCVGHLLWYASDSNVAGSASAASMDKTEMNKDEAAQVALATIPLGLPK